jgi:hypothetical protein
MCTTRFNPCKVSCFLQLSISLNFAYRLFPLTRGKEPLTFKLFGIRIDLNVEITTERILQGIKDIADNLDEQTRDRLKAYELLGKYLKLFTDKHAVSVAAGGPVTFQFVEPDND